MRSIVEFVRPYVGAALLGTLSIGTPALSREAVGKLTAATAPLNSSAEEQNRMADLFSRMTVRHHWQEDHLDRLSVARTYKVKNDKDKIVAEEAVLVEYKAPGSETFTSSSEKGSGFVLHHVFQRLMKDEEDRVRANKDPDSLINPQNYTFEIVGAEKIGDSDCSVVRATPKRDETDLFEGKIWIDNEDFAIVKITGHLAKSPSFWTKQVDFVRDYQKIDGFWLLAGEQAVSDVRVFGKETLTIAYHDYSVNGSGALQARESW
jgi:Outer membrane lipoprotein-sorting protein